MTTMAAPLYLSALRTALNSAALVRPRASPWHRFSKDQRRNRLFRCGGKCCIQKCVLHSRACPAKSEPVPSCAYRSDTSAAQHSTMSYALPHPSKNDIHFIIWRSVRYATLPQDFGLSCSGFQEPREVTRIGVPGLPKRSACTVSA